MHRGKAYHDYMLASTRDLRVRQGFQRLACRFTPSGGTILDFGAGTGIDAKTYAALGFKVQVHEPCKENRGFLVQHCRDELAGGAIVLTDLSATGAVQLIAANFAVLNLVADHEALFETFDRLLAPNGRVLASLLNPFYVGDARYRWWRQNLGGLLRRGRYAVEGEDGPIYRFAPNIVARAARPAFQRMALAPGGLRLAMSPYMFLLLQKT